MRSLAGIGGGLGAQSVDTGTLKAAHVGVERVGQFQHRLLLEGVPQRLSEEMCAAAAEHDVGEAIFAADGIGQGQDAFGGNAFDDGHVALDLAGLAVGREAPAGAQGLVHGVRFVVALADLARDGLADRRHHVVHAVLGRVAAVGYQAQAACRQPVQRARAAIDDQVLLLADLVQQAMLFGVGHQRTLRLRHHQRLVHPHLAALAYVVLTQAQALQR